MEETKDIVLVAKQAISTVKYEELNKGSIKQIVNTVKDAVSEGYLDSIDAFIYIKKMAKLSEELEKAIKPFAAGDFQGGKYERFNTEVTERDGGRYDYSTSKDPVWDALKEQADEIKLNMDARQVYLKGLKQSKEVVDQETGDTYIIHPPAKGEAMSIIVTIK